MRKTISVLRGALMVAALAAFMTLSASATPSGDWTEDVDAISPLGDTNYITSAQQLAWLAREVNSGTPDVAEKQYYIQNDLDLSAHYWVPIGTSEHPFKGAIRSADGKTISGIAMTSEHVVTGGTRYYGLVGYGQGATVSYLTLDGSVSVTGETGKTDIVGAAIAYAGKNNTTDSEVSKLTNKVTVEASGTNGTLKIGGIVGESEGAKLSGCVNDPSKEIKVTGSTNATVGGLIGEVSGDTRLAGNGGGGAGGQGGASSGPSRNNAKLAVTANSAVVGGIIGKVSTGTLSMTTRETDQSQNPEEYAKYIWNMGDLTVTPTASADVGGFIGAISGTGTCDLREAIFNKHIAVKNNNSSFAANVGGILGLQSGSEASALINCKFTTGLKVESGTTTLIDVKETAPKIDVLSSSTLNDVFTGGIYGKAARLNVESPMVGGTDAVPGNPVVQSTGSVGGIGGYSQADTAYVSGTARITNLTVMGSDHSGSVGGVFGTVDGLKDLQLSAGQLDISCKQDGSDIGGVAGTTGGSATDGTIHVVGTISVSSTGNTCNVGGFVGRNTGTLKNISLGDRTTVTCSNGSGCSVGGFAGKNTGAIDFCYSAAELATIKSATKQATNLSLGGLVGANSGTVQNCYRDLDVTMVSTGSGNDNSYIGGLIGSNTGTAGTAQVLNCYAACNVDASGVANGNTYAGGLIGQLYDGAVQNCYMAAGYTVSGGTAGGFIGQRDPTTAVQNCYAAASVTGGTKGGFFGVFNGADTEKIYQCIYLLDSGVNSGLQGVGSGNQSWTASQLTSQNKSALASQTGFPGWDFANTWRISTASGRAYDYPVLLRNSDGVTLNYDIRWYTADPAASSFTISDEADLAGLAMLVNGDIKAIGAVGFADKTITVSKAFNLQTAEWVSIGKSGAPFSGAFDGNNKLIDGLRMTVATDTGLFGVTDANTALNNVYLEALTLSGSGKAAALLPENSGTITAPRIVLSGAVTTTGNNAGCVAATNSGTIDSANVTVNNALSASGATGNAGGVVGTNSGTIGSASVTLNNTLSATGTTGYAGGVAGTNSGTIGSASVTLNNTVSAMGTTGYAGGVAGQNTGATGAITTPGLTFADGGCVSATAAAGGVVGTNSGSVTDPAYSFSGEMAFVKTETAGGSAGGVVGVNGATGSISAGALTIGRPIEATGTTGYVGGVAGKNAGTIGNTTMTLNSTVSATGTTGYAGGVTGQNAKVIADSTVQGSGTVSGTAYAGGLIGRLTADGTITSSAARNIMVSGSGFVGGAVGEALGTLTANEPNIKGITVNGVEVRGVNAANVGGAIGHASRVMAAQLTLRSLTLNAGKADADDAYVGGVAGLAENSVLRDITAGTLTANVSSTTAELCVGGVAGKLRVTANEKSTYTLTSEDKLGVYQGVTNASVTGLTLKVNDTASAVGTSNAYVGGTVGLTEKGSVYDSSVSGSLTVKGFAVICAGGTAGQATNAYLVNDTAMCGMTLGYAGAYDAGGFVGKLADSTARFDRVAATSPITVIHSDAAMNGHIYAGGFAGRISNAAAWAVSENSAAQPVSVSCQYDGANVYAGGFAGQIDDAAAKVFACYATRNCTINSLAYSYGGGFVGKLANGTVDSCYASGNSIGVSTKDAYAGGFAGTVESGTITDCYALDGTISATGTATASAGAFAGSSSGTLSSVYAAASSVTSKAGNAAAQSGDRIVIDPEQASGVTLNAGTHLTNFKFDSAARKWCYLSGKNSGRPVLTALESWDSIPDLAIVRAQGLDALTVSSADQLGAAAKLLNDDSFAKLFTDGRAARGDVTVKLAANIDLNGKLWEPIKELKTNDVLDGQDHTVSSLRSDAASYDNYGFVSTNNGTIKNLTVSGAGVTAGTPAGIVAGTNAGTIDQVTVSNSTLTGTDFAGGVVGTNSGTGTISNITVASSTTVKGKNVGGIAGTNSGTINGATTSATVQYLEVADGTVAGGAAGTNTGTVSGVTSTATVKGTTAGGVVGANSTGGKIEASRSSATVTASTTAGGVAGSNAGTVGSANNGKGDVVSDAAVNAPTVGGVAGTSAGTVQNSDWIGTDSKLQGGATAKGSLVGDGTSEGTCRTEQCAAPTASPAGGSFTAKVTVTLKTTAEGATIYYTTDGSTPTINSTQYNDPFELTDATTVKAIAVRDDLADSSVMSVTFSKYTPGGGGAAPAVTVPVSGSGGSVSLNVTVSGKAATVKALASKELSKIAGGTGGVTFDLSGMDETVETVNIPAATVKAISEAADGMTVKATEGSVSFDKAALNAIAAQASGSSVSFTVNSIAVSEFNDAQRDALKDKDVREVFELSVLSGDGAIGDFKGGTATVRVPYTLEKGQSAEGIVVWYVAADGSMTEVPATYSDGWLTFTVEHFSTYVIAYDEKRTKPAESACPQDATCPISAFTDAEATAWYHDGVHWALENGVMQGVSDSMFAPTDTTTRAQVAMMLWRLEGSPAVDYEMNYSDVGNNWFAACVRWASSVGIVNGYKDGSFGPNDPVTREQLATMLYRYAQYKKMDVSVGEDTNILSYDDAFDVHEWAMAAMQWACGSGIVNGVNKGGTLMLAPLDASTRAVVATMLWRFSK